MDSGSEEIVLPKNQTGTGLMVRVFIPLYWSLLFEPWLLCGMFTTIIHPVLSVDEYLLADLTCCYSFAASSRQPSPIGSFAPAQ